MTTINMINQIFCLVDDEMKNMPNSIPGTRMVKMSVFRAPMKGLLCLRFASHQALIGSVPDDFTCTNSSCLPNVRKISLKGAGNAVRAVSASIGSGLPTA
jgi:hypothetical protein